MKLYRATGHVPILVYFFAEDDADSFVKVEGALWTESYEKDDTSRGEVVVQTLRAATSLQELHKDKWQNSIPWFTPEFGEVVTCAEFLIAQEEEACAKAADARQLRFFFARKHQK